MAEYFIDIPSDYCCPITGELMEDPVLAPDGQSYERAAITAWFQRQKTSPLTGENLKSTFLIDNHRLRAIIQSFKETMPEIQRENQVKRDLLEAIKIRENYFEDHIRKGQEQIESISDLLRVEKERNLLYESKLAAYKMTIKSQNNQIESLKANLEHYAKRFKEKYDEVKWLNEELRKALDNKSFLKEELSIKSDGRAQIKTESEAQDTCKMICGLSPEIEKMIDCLINVKFKILIDELIKIETVIGRDDDSRSLTVYQLREIKVSLFDLKLNIEKSKRELENWREELQWETQKKFQNSSGEYSKNRLSLQEINAINLGSETEQYLRRSWSADISAFDLSTSRVDQMMPIYLIEKDKNSRINLIVYNTENRIEEAKWVNPPEWIDECSCAAQLPTHEIFCFGKGYPPSGVSLIIDVNLGVRMLPSGTPCSYSSAIYFNKNIYCFGGIDSYSDLTLSERFDLNENRWIKLRPLPNSDFSCNSIVFNGDILISGAMSCNLLRYSINNNSFTRIPFRFSENKRKILIDLGKLYLIECGNGKIYESKFWDETVWEQIGSSIISMKYSQVYCSYNRRAIFIGCRKPDKYYKFSLDDKIMVNL
ncbi:unnamed protein product [Blepharisma stoltei]|uniref:U-box domain-containing protein n=1 Tax=Blepharisma stoltei TaxID=1481888 RepID=A0AAU9IY76_9CILI|nr:unnamed protein product [Blepharisma stoltei]